LPAGIDARCPGDWEAMGAYYRAAVAEFLQAEPRVLLGELTQAQTGTTREQRRAWEEELALLQASLRRVCTSTPGSGGWGLLLEYQMYRLQRRLDAVLLAADLILVIEFKMGAEQYDASGVAQVEDYALDLRDFQNKATLLL
jgi:hypothetical protein